MESLKVKKKVSRWWKRRFTATITECDPSCKVVYLGNVLTGWAKGEGCLDKPLATLWKNYCQSSRPDVSMRLSVCSSGLQATTLEHGLTEYWAHRVTWCAAPPAYPRIFAWVYRHEGRRLKQELRCHAVLCATGSQSRQLTERLEQRLREALHDFRREKLCRQSARLSLAACLFDDYSDAIPKRKLLLAPGINNYKPPVERCKSAPKLGSIEESPEQEVEEEKDWLRVLALRGPSIVIRNNSPAARMQPSSASVNNFSSSPMRNDLLETLREEERSLPASLLPLTVLTTEQCDPSQEDVSPDGLLDLAEIKVTLMPDGGTSCVDGGPPAESAGLLRPFQLFSRMSAEARKKFGSADCVIDVSGRGKKVGKNNNGNGQPISPPMIPRRARRSLPCRAASISDYTAELRQNRILTRRQSQPEYVGVARRPISEYIESRDEYLYGDEIHFRLRLDSAVAEELLESDSFAGSSSSADHSPNLADKAGRLTLNDNVGLGGGADGADPSSLRSEPLTREDHDNVSDESGYSDDVKDASEGTKLIVTPTTKGSYTIAEEFTLNL